MPFFKTLFQALAFGLGVICALLSIRLGFIGVVHPWTIVLAAPCAALAMNFFEEYNSIAEDDEDKNLALEIDFAA